MAGKFNLPPVSGVDNPLIVAANGATPSKWNTALKLTEGSDEQIVVRSTADDGTTGMKLTSLPKVSAVVFPLTSGGTKPNGSFWVEDDGTAVTLFVKRADGSLITLVLG